MELLKQQSLPHCMFTRHKSVFQFIGDYQENRDNDGKVMGSWQPEQSKGSMADTADFEM